MATVTPTKPRTTDPPVAGPGVRVAIALAGLHRVVRGAEVAFENIARGLARTPGFDVTVFGSGPDRAGEPYRYITARCMPRERFEGWPRVPPFRGALAYEEFTFARALRSAYDPRGFDLTMTCAYPFTSWALRGRRDGRRPSHVFVTQNGDWPARARNAEYRWFACEGLVCTNPEYFERHRATRRCALVPNGVDAERFAPGAPDRVSLGLPEREPIVLVCSALAESKRVDAAIEAISHVPGAHLVVAGDGPLREQIDQRGRSLLGPRYRRVTLPHAQMPALYRAADTLLHMSVDEPFGNIYIEAMATGLPVVAHEAPTTRWITEDLGDLADARDEAAIASTLRRVLARGRTEGADPRRDLVLRRFAWPVVCAQYAAFLREVAAASAVGRAT